jgi:XTP/dITP diphosphohydrolase
VEDAGLFVESLSDFPGPFSAFVLKTIGTAGIIRLMSGKPSREAQFRSAVAVAMDGRLMAVFEGAIKGNITNSPRGKGGFGFDPIFVPEGKRTSFAQLSMYSKNNISHRGKTFRALAAWLGSKK